MLTQKGGIAIITSTATQRDKQMSKFTKTYKVELNDKQRKALGSAFKSLCEYFLNEKKADVEVLVQRFDDKKISADLIVNGAIFDTKLIGIKGGLITL